MMKMLMTMTTVTTIKTMMTMTMVTMMTVTVKCGNDKILSARHHQHRNGSPTRLRWTELGRYDHVR